MADTIEPRLAVLEQIARNTETALGEIRTELRGIRGELGTEIRDIRSEMRSQFRWLLGIIIAVLLAQSALWLQVGQLTSLLRKGG